MIAKGGESSVGALRRAIGWWPPLALMLLTIVLQIFASELRPALRYERMAVADGQWWRLLSAHVMHLGAYHCALNVLAIGVWMLLCPQRWSPAGWLLRYGVLALGIGVGLFAFQPEQPNYVGLSGVVHGLFVLGLLPEVRRREPVAVMALLVLGAKLTWEQVAGIPLSDEAAIGGHVVTAAHLFGALSALGYAAAGWGWRRGRDAWRSTTTQGE